MVVVVVIPLVVSVEGVPLMVLGMVLVARVVVVVFLPVVVVVMMMMMMILWYAVVVVGGQAVHLSSLLLRPVVLLP